MPNVGPLELVDACFFDTLSLPLGMRSLDRAEMFEIPIGAMSFHDPLTGVPRLKNYTETNLYDSGAISPPQKFLVESIRAALFARRGELIPIGSRYYRGVVLDFNVRKKTYWRSPLWRVVDPSVLFASADWSGFDKEERLELVRSLRHTFSAESRIWIEHSEPFGVSLMFDPSFDWQNGAAPGSLVVALEGTLGRPVM